MKKELSPAMVGVLSAVAIVVVIGGGWLFFQKTVGTPSVDIELAKKQAAVEHSQFADKVNSGAPPDAGAGERAARAQTSGK